METGGKEAKDTAPGPLCSFSRKEVIIPGELGRWGLLRRSCGDSDQDEWWSIGQQEK